MKRCYKCGKERKDKDIRHTTRKELDYATCRWCRIEYKYGLNEEGYWKLFKKQEGKCAICQVSLLSLPFQKWKGRQDRTPICIDHTDELYTIVVRGLLCRHCNAGLGSFKDNPKTLLRAVKYLLGELNEDGSVEDSSDYN